MPVISGYLEQWADGSPINLVVILLTLSYIAVLAMQKTLKQVTEVGSTTSATPTSTSPTPTSTTTDARTRLSQFRYLNMPAGMSRNYLPSHLLSLLSTLVTTLLLTYPLIYITFFSSSSHLSLSLTIFDTTFNSAHGRARVY